ncbi:MAG TPA: phosphate butyryltransferase [Candidatus Tidjanibacter faecipullorum]|uniref:Phosphate butyryltransferase n=1 Tax=Candidatus Tidjanibacter faecipullorum TaxID=2838766 RepID=A0A9D2DCY0_9BACT|nr:phosphate butyryltransferase [Candidatus Tidjanibacter faecipullorum]
MIKHLDELVAKAKARGKRRLIVAYGQDSHTLEAVNDAIEAGIVDVTIVGDPQEIEKVCKAEGIDMSRFEIVPETVDVNCVRIAVQMISEGKGDVLMKGLVSTDKYMRGILSKEFGLVPPKGVLSHVAVLQIPAYHKLLTIGDVAVIPYPDFGQKTAIAKYIIQTAKKLEIDVPKVACIAPSEQLLPSVQSSIEAAMIAKMGERGQLGSKVYIDGPLALDVAVNKEAAQTKKLDNPVVGDADCLLFPNIDAGNVFFKACTKFGGAELAAMVVGAKVPCVLTSRGDSRKTKMYSIALACLSAK